MMESKDLQDLLVDYLYEELEPAKKAAFEAALEGHPEVRAELEDMQAAREAFSSLDDEEVPAGITDALMQEAARAAPPVRAPGFFQRLRASLSPWVLHPGMSAAAVMLVVVGVSVYVYRYSGPPSAPGPGNEAPIVMRMLAPAGQSDPAGVPAKDKALAKAEPKREGSLKRDQLQDDRNKLGETLQGYAQQGKKRAGKRAYKGRPAAVPAQQSARVAQQLDPDYAVRKQRADSLRYAKRPRRVRSAKPLAKRAANTADTFTNRAEKRQVWRKSRRRSGSSGDIGSGGAVANGRLAAAPKPSAPKTAAPAKKAKTEQASPAQLYKQGRLFVKKGSCYQALDYYTRALSADPKLRYAIETSLGSCRGTLAGSKQFAWLASQVRQVVAARKRASAKRAKAKRRKASAIEAQQKANTSTK